ncbi:hypothetical protein MCOR02_008458 [Pyricularia oryzae]|uniref:Trichodiene oxygenase n=4 Tax=Pyricularia TaxID=48558 RepID=A0ABQ8NW82_PYRGI|nr:benzoate 4-monooxygenase cytochrome P450 [Pyricularia oryzae 70-15]KAH8843680.1 hypothetical protein MCOR01_004471 [Pyricularia oryzae]KAI6302738.1 hypothetical protein MCOR33_002008 [Pyricularia grisea]EHA50585.1 benzoate 4-monooxygenase cytochrome P450 [Pyricularia oryzae 70-15]KAH9431150.1 hypothetical protein MCOR02_008458 [Pyricularia oryzae]KAI6254714.1 hypothetical protein MCOR19_008759 [Pyricularia oryzae]
MDSSMELGGGPGGVAVLTFKSIAWMVGLWMVYKVGVALYNISPFHPLAAFPGPKIAAASYLYEGYWDFWRVGRYTKVIEQMHKKYGPIVRINPDELHCSDPLFVHEIYAGPGRVRDRWQHAINTGGSGPIAVTGFSTISHELHRQRRAPLNRFFSRQQMLKLEGEVLDYAQRTVAKMLRTEAGRGAFEIKEAFNCFTADVIGQYAFGQTMGFVDQEGWEPSFATMVGSFLRSAYVMRHVAIARWASGFLPFMADYLGEDIRYVMNMLAVTIPGYIKASLDDPQNGRVFADLMQDDKMPEEEKSMYRLSGEGFNFLLAGTETTAATLTSLTFHLLDQPKLYARLMKDLEGVDPDKPKWTDVERRPYVWALVHESLRTMPGVSHRSARIAREEELVYKSQDGKWSYVVPRGTPIGQTSMISHWDEKLFPDPDRFDPERWLLEDGTPNVALAKYLIAFGKGSRSCLGENLAYCEVYIMLALVAYKILPRAKLVDTTIEDLTYDHDLIVLQTKKGSISVKVAIE